jgi:hypothetical protein
MTLGTSDAGTGLVTWATPGPAVRVTFGSQLAGGAGRGARRNGDACTDACDRGPVLVSRGLRGVRRPAGRVVLLTAGRPECLCE